MTILNITAAINLTINDPVGLETVSNIGASYGNPIIELQNGEFREYDVLDQVGARLIPILDAAQAKGMLTYTTAQSGSGSLFLDSLFRILNTADNTKQISFNAAGITPGNTREITVPDYDFDLKKPVVDCIQFDTAHPPGVSPEGHVSWNAADWTLNISTGQGPVLQVGQELHVIIYNGTGSQIGDGKAVYPVGAVGGRPEVALANASTFETIKGVVLITTMAIPNGQFGIAAQTGKVRDIDTSAWSFGDTLWVSAAEDGELTNVHPEFPNYTIQVGGVTTSHESAGDIQLELRGSPEDTVFNFWNGVFREKFDFTVDSDGVIITGSLQPSDGHPNLTMMFSDGFVTLVTSPPATIALTAGIDSNPQVNYVYILQSTKVLTVSTSSWPVFEHIKVAELALKSAVVTALEGSMRNQNWNDAVQDRNFQGHLSHIGEKLRQFEAQWDSGVEGSVVIDTGPTPDAVYVKTTAGNVYQMHKHSFPFTDMTPYDIDAVNIGASQFTISDDGDLSVYFPSGRCITVHNSTGNDGFYVVVSVSYSAPDFAITVSKTIPDATADGLIGDDIHAVNDSVAPYESVTDLSSVLLDAEGVSLVNRAFSFVIWGVQNKSNQPQHLMMNLPSSSYPANSPDTAVSDPSNYSVYSIPILFQGVGFLIARFTFVLDPAGTSWTLYNTEDLRGKIPNTTAGGGAGGTGVTSFLGLLDTPSSYGAQATNVVRVGSGETALEFYALDHSDLSSTGAARTIAGGVISGDGTSRIVVDTQDAASTDDLDSISGTPAEGDRLILSAADDARTVVVKNGTIKLSGSDMSLDNRYDTLMLIYLNSAWVELSRSDNGA